MIGPLDFEMIYPMQSTLCKTRLRCANPSHKILIVSDLRAKNTYVHQCTQNDKNSNLIRVYKLQSLHKHMQNKKWATQGSFSSAQREADY